MLKNIIILLVLVLAFANIFKITKSTAGIQYQKEIKNITNTKVSGNSSEIGKNFFQYGSLAGVAVGVVAFALSAGVFWILKMLKLSREKAMGLSNVIAYGWVVGLGIALVFVIDKNSVLTAAIAHFVDKPLLYSGLLAFILSIVFLVIAIRKEKIETAA